MQDALITYEQLQEIFGGSSVAELVARMDSQNVPYITGKRGRPATTFSALNHTLGIPITNSTSNTDSEEDHIEI